MTSTNPKYRRPLKPEQIEILHLLYRFRFVTTNLIANYQNKPNGTAVFNRLRILCEQEYIGRKFDNSYRLLGKPASYHLLAKGINLLKKDPDYDARVLHATHKDKTASDQFINHWLTVFQVYMQLRNIYGDYFDLFTKSELTEFDYFPKNLPDAYISLKGANKGRTKHYILLVFEEDAPHFACVKRIKELIQHDETGTWDEAIGKPPAVLIVCESIKQQKVLRPKIAKLMQHEDYTSPRYYVTDKEAVRKISDANTDIWQSVIDPVTMCSLRQM